MASVTYVRDDSAIGGPSPTLGIVQSLFQYNIIMKNIKGAITLSFAREAGKLSFN
jgi:hypothetical protein